MKLFNTLMWQLKLSTTDPQCLQLPSEKPRSTYLYLLHSWSLEPQVKTVITQAPNLRVTFLIAYADDRDLRSFDQLY